MEKAWKIKIDMDKTWKTMAGHGKKIVQDFISRPSSRYQDPMNFKKNLAHARFYLQIVHLWVVLRQSNHPNSFENPKKILVGATFGWF